MPHSQSLYTLYTYIMIVLFFVKICQKTTQFSENGIFCYNFVFEKHSSTSNKKMFFRVGCHHIYVYWLQVLNLFIYLFKSSLKQCCQLHQNLPRDACHLDSIGKLKKKTLMTIKVILEIQKDYLQLPDTFVLRFPK